MALDELPISDYVKTALLKKEGRCGALYQLVLCYEKADWNEMTWHAKLLQIPMDIITRIYFECVEYVNSIWNSLLSQNVDGDAQAAADTADMADTVSAQ